MTGNFILEEHRNTFGGIINYTDYCTDFPRHEKAQSWADRIYADLLFDKKCIENIKARKRTAEVDK